MASLEAGGAKNSAAASNNEEFREYFNENFDDIDANSDGQMALNEVWDAYHKPKNNAGANQTMLLAMASAIELVADVNDDDWFNPDGAVTRADIEKAANNDRVAHTIDFVMAPEYKASLMALEDNMVQLIVGLQLTLDTAEPITRDRLQALIKNSNKESEKEAARYFDKNFDTFKDMYPDNEDGLTIRDLLVGYGAMRPSAEFNPAEGDWAYKNMDHLMYLFAGLGPTAINLPNFGRWLYEALNPLQPGFYESRRDRSGSSICGLRHSIAALVRNCVLQWRSTGCIIDDSHNAPPQPINQGVTNMAGNEMSLVDPTNPPAEAAESTPSLNGAPESWTMEDAQQAANAASLMLTEVANCNLLDKKNPSCKTADESHLQITNFGGLLDQAQQAQPEMAAEFRKSLRDNDLFKAALPNATLHYLDTNLTNIHDPRIGKSITPEELTSYRDELPIDSVERDVLQYAIDHFSQIRDFDKKDGRFSWLIPSEVWDVSECGISQGDLAKGIDDIDTRTTRHALIPTATFLSDNWSDITEHETINNFDLLHYARERQAAGDTDKYNSTMQAVNFADDLSKATKQDILRVPPWPFLPQVFPATGISKSDLWVVMNSQDALAPLGLSDDLLTRVEKLATH